MMRKKVTKACVLCVILFGAVINMFYGFALVKEFFALQLNDSVREILISAIALEFGWAVLLLWALGDPCARRHVVLLTAIPMLIGNLFHSLNQALFAGGTPMEIVANLLIGTAVAGLFVLAFVFSSPLMLPTKSHAAD
jgi:hypothetical protein